MVVLEHLYLSLYLSQNLILVRFDVEESFILLLVIFDAEKFHVLMLNRVEDVPHEFVHFMYS